MRLDENKIRRIYSVLFLVTFLSIMFAFIIGLALMVLQYSHSCNPDYKSSCEDRLHNGQIYKLEAQPCNILGTCFKPNFTVIYDEDEHCFVVFDEKFKTMNETLEAYDDWIGLEKKILLSRQKNNKEKKICTFDVYEEVDEWKVLVSLLVVLHFCLFVFFVVGCIVIPVFCYLEDKWKKEESKEEKKKGKKIKDGYYDLEMQQIKSNEC